MEAPLTATWSFDCRASATAAWSLLSDTDRFNRAAGFGYRFTTERRADGETVRVGRASKLGVPLVWEELPWSWSPPDPSHPEVPGVLDVGRLFRGGPVASLRVCIEVFARGEHSQVRYTLQLVPRHFLARPIVALDLAWMTRPEIEAVLRRAIDWLDGKIDVFDPPPPALPAPARARLDAALDGVDPKVADALRQTLTRWPESEQARLRPLALARAWGTDPDATLAGFLAATRGGALAMRWELLCPVCRGAKGDRDLLAPGPREAHCDSCNITYDATFPESVEVVFRPDPAVRAVDVQVACASSPSHTPHIVAQARLPANTEVTTTVSLRAGSYRVRDARTGVSAVVEVSDDAPRADLALDLDDAGFHPPTLRVAPGASAVFLRSRLDRVTVVAIEERWRPADTLTAGALLARPEWRILLPEGAIAPGLDVEIGAGVVVCVDAGLLGGSSGASPSAIDEALGQPRGVRRQEAITVAGYDTAADAIAAVAALAGLRRVGIALDVGSIVWIDGVPSGPTVDATLARLRRNGVGRIAARDRAVESPDVVTALHQHQVRVRLTRTAHRGDVWLTAPVPPAQPEPVAAGTQVAHRWRLTERLGEGAFGEVWAAAADEAEVAVKLLRSEADNPDAVQSFYTEARLLARVKAPQVVRVHDYGTTPNGRPYLVMERLHGRGLDARLAEGPLSPSEAVGVGRAICAALAATHAAGVLHRDLKPSNVMMTPDGPKLIDFGIAHDLTDAPADPSEPPRVILGTPRYMSPEQLNLEPLDGRSDLYALGLTLYQALSGRLPWDADAAAVSGGRGTAEIYRRLSHPPTPLTAVAPQPVPPALEAAILRAVALERDDRFPDAAALDAALTDATA
jgi:hypothetical protein